MHRARFFWGFWLAVAVSAGAAHAQRWEGYSDPTGCSASREYEDGTSIDFGLSTPMDWTSMIVWNRRWASIAESETLTIRAELDDGASFQLQGSGMVTEEGSHGVFTASEGLDFITAVMRGRWLRLWNGSQLIGQYSLSGSREALLEAARCTSRIAAQPRPDPFAD